MIPVFIQIYVIHILPDTKGFFFINILIADVGFLKEAQTYYVYISSIKQDVVYAYDKTAIDFSFVEAITSDSLDYFEKMEYINNYEKKEWKNVTNSSEKPPKKLGFK